MYHVPGRPLSDFVALFWYYRGNEVPNATERVLPTGAVNLIIRLDSGRPCDSGMFGPHTRSVVIKTTSRYEMIGVHFRVGGAFPFLRFPVDELQNAGIAINDLWGERDAQRLLWMLREASTREAKFLILEQWLMRSGSDRLQK